MVMKNVFHNRILYIPTMYFNHISVRNIIEI